MHPGHAVALAALTLGHDTLIGILLALAGLLTIGYARDGAQNLRQYAIGGAAVTIVIGVLLFFGLV